MEGYLHFPDGDVFKGKWETSVKKDAKGEIVFFTGMTGYQEVLTDPSYKNQIVVFSYPLIGNYGINANDFESLKPHVAGVVVYEAKEMKFHYEAKYSLKEYLQKWDIPLLSHVDTRACVKRIRMSGSMPAVMSVESSFPSFELSAANKYKEVSCIQPNAVGAGDYHIVLVDFGYKKSMVTSLIKRNCKVTIVPFDTGFKKISSLNPDGILLSNGPGDPMDLKQQLPEIKKLVQAYPTLGICLGHQVAALALGATTKKLLFGHRGANHPVQDLERNKIFMTSQNHSYVVDEQSIYKTGLTIRHKNLHDGSIEGFSHENLLLKTVQFHPEAHPGPIESEYIFDEFLTMVSAARRRLVNYA